MFGFMCMRGTLRQRNPRCLIYFPRGLLSRHMATSCCTPKYRNQAFENPGLHANLFTSAIITSHTAGLQRLQKLHVQGYLAISAGGQLLIAGFARGRLI